MRQLLVRFFIVGALAGCSDPLSNVPRFSDIRGANNGITVAEVPSAAARSDDQSGGLFSRIRNRNPEDATNAAIEAALRDLDVTPDQAPDLAELNEPENVAEAEVVLATASDDARPRRGLGGLFGRRADNAEIPRNGPDVMEVAAGTTLPLGQMARVCGLSRNQLGARIDSAAGFQIFDTKPGGQGRRAFYITGFADGCARTFTGAVVIPGDVQTHEFVRYQSSNGRIEYTSVDNAYEAIKASVCRVGRGQPCGAATDRLNQNTHFLSVYDLFGGTFNAVPTEWAQILLHDESVVEVSVKKG